MFAQLRERLGESYEVLGPSFKTDFNYLTDSLMTNLIAKKLEKKDVIKLRLILPGSIQGRAGVFQSRNAVSFQRRALSPELLIVSGNYDTELQGILSLPITKIGICFIVAIGAVKKPSYMYLKGMEGEESVSRANRAVGRLQKMETRSLSPKTTARSRSPKSSLKSTGLEAAPGLKAAAAAAAGLKSPTVASLKPAAPVTKNPLGNWGAVGNEISNIEQESGSERDEDDEADDEFKDSFDN
jgi:hypothetical protein